jgi:hypothetical protein
MQNNNYQISKMEKLIQLKLQSKPYLSSGNIIPQTDVDSFPYKRFYRGEYQSLNPIIFDREAGWSHRCDKIHIPIDHKEEVYYPNHCFQGPVTTVYPCMSEYQRKYSDKKEMDLQLYRTRVNEYR